VTPVASPFPLRDYAFIADGERGALIGPDGSLAWLCFPGWGDPAVIAGLLGSGGRYHVAPVDRWVPGGSYEDGTLIWRSRWVTDHGIVECREAFVCPGSPDRAVILRQVTAVDGHHRVRAVLGPAADYGRRSLLRWERDEQAWVTHGEGMAVRWSGASTATMGRRAAERGHLVAELDLEEGATWDLVLELAVGSRPDGDPPRPDECWRRTEAFWRSVVPACADTVAPRDARHSIAVLTGLTSASGGTAAAATMALPERAEAGRNYDYRYAWVRDTCCVGRVGAIVDGAEAILDGAVRWTVDRLLADGPTTRPAYTVGGDRVPGEARLDLPGYPGGFDVVGNRAGDQFQLDVFGQSLSLLADAALADRLDVEGWQAAETAVAAVEQRWTEPDAGIWETSPNRWTQSRLMCVAGLRAISAAGAPATLVRRTLPLADRILADTDQSCLHPSGRWQRAPDDERVDGSLLLPELRGALPPDDPRTRATRLAIAEALDEDGYLYRYAHGSGPLFEDEGAFLICNFWMALACLRAGDAVSGARRFERSRAACGPAELYSEEFDVRQRQMRGNVPQAFVHAAMVECSVASEWP
jgi:alpha,alpha-trehalase